MESSSINPRILNVGTKALNCKVFTHTTHTYCKVHMSIQSCIIIYYTVRLHITTRKRYRDLIL